MINSKWFYVSMGATTLGAILSTVIQNLVLVFVYVVFCAINWYCAESFRKMEEEKIRNESQIERTD